MTRPWFDGQMARLGGLRFPPADLLTHWEALQDMPDGALEAAVTRSQKTRVDFPTPADLRQDADLAYRPAVDDVEDRAVELDEPVTFTVPQTGQTVTVTREHRYYCERCSDTGFASEWCGEDAPQRKPWMEFGNCGRYGAHGNHELVSQCACWESNQALVRKREAQRKYAEAPGRGQR